VATASGWSNIAEALRNRHFRTYQGSRFLAQIAIWMYKVAIGWIVWDMTHSAAWLGVFGLLDHAPSLFIMPIAGALADRMDTLKFMRITQALLLVQSVLLSILLALDLVNLPVLIVFVLIYGIVTAAQQPASQSIIPFLLPRNSLTAAYGLNSLSFNISRFIGPMIGGLVITFWGTAPAIFCNAIGAAIFSVGLMRTQMHFSIPRRQSTASTHMFRDIQDGLRYAVRHRGIGPSMGILTALSVLPFTIDLLLPSLADGVYKAGANGLAWMSSMMGIGAMTQAVLIARLGSMSGLTRYFVWAILGLALAFVGLSISPNFWVALVCVFLIGFMSSSARVTSMTLLQYGVAADMRGRVASFYSVITHAGPAFASLIVGLAGDRFGIPATMAAIGIATFGIWFWALRSQRDMEETLERDPAARPPDAKETPPEKPDRAG
jgi:MFS family permease